MEGYINGVYTKLREKGFKYSYFKHCSAHILKLVIGQISEKIKGVEMFFSNLRAFNKFTSSSTKRSRRISIPSLCETRWCKRSRTVSVVKDQREIIKDALYLILQKPVEIGINIHFIQLKVFF